MRNFVSFVMILYIIIYFILHSTHIFEQKLYNFYDERIECVLDFKKSICCTLAPKKMVLLIPLSFIQHR